jgi:hypothetical protein
VIPAQHTVKRAGEATEVSPPRMDRHKPKHHGQEPHGDEHERPAALGDGLRRDGRDPNARLQADESAVSLARVGAAPGTRRHG